MEQNLKLKDKKYLIDGNHYTHEEVMKLFSNSKLGKREKKVLALLGNVENQKTIVDLGCLYGNFSKTIKEKFPKANIIAGDYLEEHLEIARLLHPALSSNFRILNAYDLDLQASCIDIVTFQEVIEHLEGAAQAVKEINRVLKIGGELILSTPTPYYWRDMWQCFKYELIRKYYKRDLPLSDAIYFQQHEWNRHIYCWTPSTLYTLLKVNGFEYIAHDYCQDGQGFIEKQFLKLFPFFSPTIIIKVKKVAEAFKRLT